MPLRGALIVVGVVLGLCARTVAVDSAGLAFAARTSGGPLFLLIVGWSVMAAAVVVLEERRRSAVLLYAIGAWWFIADLASPSVGFSIPFTLALVLYAAGPALVTHLGLSYPAGRLPGWPHATIVAGGYIILLGVVGIAGTSVLDLARMGCRTCPTNLLLISGDPVLLDHVRLLGIVFGAGWLLLALGAVAWRVVSASPAARTSVGPIGAGSCVFLCASTAWYLSSLSAGALVSGGPALTVWQLQGISLLAVAVAMCIELWCARRARRDLTRLVVQLAGASPGGMRAALAERLGDPDLLIAYPIDAGRRYVDAAARDMTAQLTPPTDRSVTRLLRGGSELATIVHRQGLLTQPQEVNDLVISVQLALANERLAAEHFSQLTQIRASGARIVAAADTERRRVERDLHDGAQQRLIALLLTLRLIQSEVTLPAFVDAESALRGTIVDLRRLAHGVYPVLLKDAGLRVALDALGDERRLSVEGHLGQRYPDVIETTAYAVISWLSAAGPASVRLAGNTSILIIEVAVDGRPQTDLNLYDRVGTLGGTLDLTSSEKRTDAILCLPLEMSTADSTHHSTSRPDKLV